MKTTRLIMSIFIVAIFCSNILNAQNIEATLLTASEITVKNGHNAQFMEGVKLWKECYLKDKGENTWGMWRRDQGEGNVYVMTGTMPNWAEMDKEDERGKDCYMTIVNFIWPHVEKVDQTIAKTMPDISRAWPEDAKYCRVTYYKVNKFYAFEEVISAVGNSIKEKEGTPRVVWHDFRLGGPESPDYMAVMPFTKYADLDISRDRPAKIYTDAVGQEKADEMWVKWFDTVDDSWSYTFTLMTELSN